MAHLFAAAVPGGYGDGVDGWRLLTPSPATTSSDAAATSLPGRRGRRKGPRPLLCISDIMGDLAALESVLSAVRTLDLQGIVACGNHCAYGPEPFEVWSRLQSLGAHLTAGPTDIALGHLDRLMATRTPSSAADDAHFHRLIESRLALGDVVARRLGELPTTLVVSLENRSGVMALHGSPLDDGEILIDDDELAHHVASVAEDVLVTGAGVPFARRTARDLHVLHGDDPDADLDDDDDVVRARMASRAHDPEVVVDHHPARDHDADDLDFEDALDGPSNPERDDELPPLLVVNVGSIAENAVRAADGRRTAHAVLLFPDDAHGVQAFARHVPVGRRSRARQAG